MSKIDEVRSAMVQAMKAGDKQTKETLSMLLAALKNKAIDKRDTGHLKGDQADKGDAGDDSSGPHRDHRGVQPPAVCP